MASFGQQAAPRGPSRHPPHGGYAPPQMAAAAPGAPAGTFASGTKIQVGGHRVVIQKYLSEGGFAHVYLVKMPQPIDGTDLAVLKRVAVPDKEALRGMRTEVETMKRLKGHRMIVTYIDSHASELKGGGYEVFLLMEYCSGGGLIDFMNTRLQHRLTEPEILNIFCDIAEGVACMHYLKPPLLHRDLKIENVLITSKGSAKRFKLCDFGSASPPKPAPTTTAECRLMDEDVQKHTTLQYRSPEMVDVYRKQPMDEKSDIWALGVFLYKLCYYTTPFEDQGQLAILNASYRFPSSPPFSDRLKRLIASMLREQMQSRPNIYQILKEACEMQGRKVPIHDIYAERSHSETRKLEKPLPKEPTSSGSPAVGAVWSPPVEEKPKLPDITPMRRGRPTASPAPGPKSNAPRAGGGDPFAALDSAAAAAAGAPGTSSPDNFSSRFPSLDQFSLLHDQGSKFDFGDDPNSPQTQAPAVGEANNKITERLADDAFASNRPSPPTPRVISRPASASPAQPSPRPAPQQLESSKPRVPIPPKPEISRAQSIISSNPELQAISSNSSANYVSTGTSTDDLPFDPQARLPYRSTPIQAEQPRRSLSRSKQPDLAAEQAHPSDVRTSSNSRLTSNFSSHIRHPSQPRQVLESSQPPSDIEVAPRKNSLHVSRSRPQSVNYESNTTIDYLRERESMPRVQNRLAQPSPRGSPRIPSPNLISTEDEPRAEKNDLDFLRSMEDSENKTSNKRSSLSSLSGSKQMLASRFGEAFKRFETTPTPPPPAGRRDLTPIAGSEATDGRSDDGKFDDDYESMTPEARREMERRKLEEEEQRVEAAQAEYRRRVAEGGSAPESAALPRSIGGVPRAKSIQNRVQNLLNEDQRTSTTVQKTAEGYGKYSDAATAASKVERQPPEIPRKPVVPSKLTGRGPASPVIPTTPKPQLKPVAPKKPGHLNSIPTGNRPPSPPKRSQTAASEQLIAFDLPGQPALEMSGEDKDNYIRDFSQRFPSLSAMEGAGPRQ
ncbi:unnamed protein product [Clonostachys rosea f. rosea IK726]|uniref:non-specific serine/threonine protein kinase n=2 Tax=Bionectria ochroleuca TaxID=29856 RepID=A0A0B7JTU4_BIOOC|nr:unnamed protein product [Clonostachys rosea f. rosea IK726]